ncbi:MAG: malonyl-ACP O-methyltransferase BioC [Gammaproteobacteria bacterium]|nr:malonyl-ACP O-methyltransferase BioC [Gammaproteobacteria bacterium]
MDLLNPPRLDKKAIKKSFNRSARSYDKSAVLQAEILNRLLERLQYIKLEPRVVLDLGCGTGQAIRGLKKRYPKAHVLALDMADEMLSCARQQYGMFERKWLVNADMEQLPLCNNSVDLVFSNLALQWSNDLHQALNEFKRVGRAGGLLMFTTFGVNTLKEMRHSFMKIDPATPRVHQFMDMHDIGDMMVAAGLAEPVMDMESLTMKYQTFTDLTADLKAIGATNAESTRSRGLMTAHKLNRLQEAYESIAYIDNHYQATYEVIYGHAWF